MKIDIQALDAMNDTESHKEWVKLDPDWERRGYIYMQGVDRVRVWGYTIPNYYRARLHLGEQVRNMKWNVSHNTWDDWRLPNGHP